MNNEFNKQLEDIEIKRYRNKQKFKQIESTGEAIYCHTQETNNVLALVFEGYQGDRANTFYGKKEELYKNVLIKNNEYIEFEKEAYKKMNRVLNEQEEEAVYWQRKKRIEGEGNDY
ncbi:hypothetical protein M2475_000510 [Breznakia sp. PF5-3]|uniref:hypothetical protein n=1 Tax=unclassified Breznakia TaxID=2623764 RepID=UPI002405DE2A|nr:MULTISPECIES: hypothetical protein [unclassified Breznakia]MDF9824160.1 hypothetical protein [Breznakia sp. PM6-1]MDF9834958.1 hypothetical protein [Breznakia sp. PF5-3]MDF9837173.1 hypothetical protein [Breznakia sp. PFB2-8]MDF9859163.1 hypothetical protein [Breznakia sp. PH5-24]